MDPTDIDAHWRGSPLPPRTRGRRPTVAIAKSVIPPQNVLTVTEPSYPIFAQAGPSFASTLSDGKSTCLITGNKD